MYSLRQIIPAVLLTSLLTAMTAVAQEMPAGPPEEMKKLAFLEGEWDAAMEWKMSDTVETWTKSAGVCRYHYILNGAVMQMEFTSLDTLMPFVGLSLECFDRETGQWQTIWIDNLGSRMTLLTGIRGDGKAVFTGQDRWQGQTFLSRTSTFDETDTSFNWTVEMSTDGGKTWITNGKATYTKKMK